MRVLILKEEARVDSHQPTILCSVTLPTMKSKNETSPQLLAGEFACTPSTRYPTFSISSWLGLFPILINYS